ncbi:hypothetical protein [Novipirellula artificiosorum]|uniref:Uncharacterized protein n=1 Tax=Novipirellula artificiosorum TaxID=2528016 RepID=A0A5C6E378_9BACT|nr:hypothetical protein [Novipirellula artificiosorum]TWU42417.1 hypothetical protein Poly41_07140 [Novipirellula artificiosorum]
MWKTNELGHAAWQDHGTTWWFDARGGEHGIAIGMAPDPQFAARFRAVEHDTMPSAAEQFVRGDQWHVVLPQQTESYSLRLAFQPIRGNSDRMLFEVTVSLETSLLDTQPMLELLASGKALDSIGVPESLGAPADQGCPPISIATGPTGSIAVLLGPHDYPFTTDETTDAGLRLRLFGQFLEKGVIRKARPWILITRSGDQPSHDELRQIYRELADSPLPLTS